MLEVNFLQIQNFNLILIMNFLLCKFIPKNWVSRTKTLLKRRKIATKNRPISTKKLKQQQKLYNYAHQYKALQIQKQLDRRTYASQHINQLIDQIFYPDVTQAHEEAARLHIQSSTLKQHNLQLSNNMEMDQINEKILATDVIQYYNRNSEKFQGEHFVGVLKRLVEYFKKRDKIKADVQRKWNKMNQTMKKNDKNYQEKKCPYLFIDRDDTFHYTPWNTMINDLCSKFQGVKSTDEGYLDTIFLFAQIVYLINAAVHYVPYKVYEIFDKYLIQLKPQQLSQLQPTQYHNLIKSISLKNKIRIPTYHTLTTPSQTQQKHLSQIRQIKMIITLKLLSSPQITPTQISDILKVLKSGVLPFTDQLAQKFKYAVLRNSNLVELSFQKVVDLLYLFVKINPTSNTSSSSSTQILHSDFLQLIKFDILRKSPNTTNINYLFKCMQLIWNKHIQPRPNPNPNPNPNQTLTQPTHKLYGNDLLLQCAHTLLSKYTSTTNKKDKITTSMLNSKQTLQLINILYRNHVSHVNLLEFLSGEIIKNKEILSLGEVTQAVFKVFLLGYRSWVLVRVLFDEQKKKYHETRKKILNQDIQLLTGKTDPNQISQTYIQQSKIPPEQLRLEQDLIISLWLLFSVNPSGKKLPIPLEQLLTIYPTSTQSKHPLIYQFCLNLNQYTKTHNILFKIRTQIPTQRNTSKIRNRFDMYYQHEQNSPVINLMKIQAVQSYQFYHNYHIGHNKFIPHPWSQTNIYDPELYVKYLMEDKSGGNYFCSGKQVSERVKKGREEIVEGYKRKGMEKREDLKNKDTGGQGQERFYKID